MPAAGPSASTTPLPSTHPLIAELNSLRQQLAQYQKSGHQSAIQLQGARLELNFAKEESAVLRETNDTLRSEISVLRTHPLPPTQPPTSTALAELTLAHRRLSTKLDLTEQALQSAQLELASCSQEIGRLNREREGDRAIINELRRGDEEREEEIAWERGERKKAEALKRLCDLALDDYKDLVQSLDPRAVPPSSPTTKAVIDPPTDLSARFDSDTQSEPEAATKTTTAESISNLLVGQRGVNRLFEDFTSTLSTKDKELHSLKDRLEELEHTLSTITDQLHTETSLRIEAESQRDRILRDDASAAKVVERYMTFTQKTHATVHLHLDNLRARSAATQLSLRKELGHANSRLAGETERAERLRGALDEASENLMREVGGRRREVGLRLKMISNEEKRERKIESWLDRVRRQRDGVEGAVLEADILESLLDEGIEAYSLDKPSSSISSGWGIASKDKQRSWKGMLGRKRGNSTATTDTDGGESASIARVLLAEELVDTLVRDLQVETERRMALEQQRVEWLAKEAVEGRDAEELDEQGEGNGDGVMFDLDQHDEPEPTLDQVARTDPNDGEAVIITSGAEGIDKVQSLPVSAGQGEPASTDLAGPTPTPMTIPLETPPPLEPTPSLTNLQSIFQPLKERYHPIQQSLHSLSYSLSDLRSSLPSSSTSSNVNPTSTGSKRPMLNFRRSPLADPVLLNILEGIHESLEDARVDVEIAIADEDRVYRGFEALLGVGSASSFPGSGTAGSSRREGGGVVQTKDVLEDARAFVAHKSDSPDFERLKTKVGDLELDLSTVKSKIHEIEGMDLATLDQLQHQLQENDAGHSLSPDLRTSMNGSSNPLSPNLNTEERSRFPTVRRPSIWSKLELRTTNSNLSPPTTPLPEEHGGAGGRRKLGLFGGVSVSSVGRSLSAGVIGAPRKVGGFAGGLYRPKKKVGEGEGESLIHGHGESERSGEGDDVE